MGFSYRDLLLQSSNPAYKKWGKIVVVPKYYDQVIRMLKEEVLEANYHVYLGLLSDIKALGKFQESKDI